MNLEGQNLVIDYLTPPLRKPQHVSSGCRRPSALQHSNEVSPASPPGTADVERPNDARASRQYTLQSLKATVLRKQVDVPEHHRAEQGITASMVDVQWFVYEVVTTCVERWHARNLLFNGL